MRKIENIGLEGFQKHTIPLADGDLILRLRFLSSVQLWQMKASYNDKNITGVKLTGGVLHIRSANFPFDFIVEDASGAGLDPFRADDFLSGRTSLYMLESDEIATIRGQKV